MEKIKANYHCLTVLNVLLERKRKFKQSYDLIIALKNIDLKKTDNHMDIFAQVHYDRGKKVKVCALVGPELKEAAKSAVDTVVNIDEFNCMNICES